MVFALPGPGPAGHPTGGRSRPVVLDAAQTAIIPLRPLTVGEILDAAFLVMQRNARQMIGLPLVIAGGAAVWMLVGVGVWFVLGNTTVQGIQIAGVIIVGLVGLLLLVLSLVWVTALLSRSTLQTALGEGFAPAGTLSWRSALPILGPMLGLTGLQYVAISALQTVVGVLYYAVLLAGLAFGDSGAVVGSIAATVISFAVQALGYGYLSLTVPALANETARAPGWIGKPAKPTNPLTAFERSLKLIGLRGAGRVLAIFAGAFGVSYVVVGVLATGLYLCVYLFATTLGAQAEQLTRNPWAIGGSIALAAVIALSAVVAFTSAVQTLLYLDLRMRREGLDLALRFDCVPVPQPAAPPMPVLTTGYPNPTVSYPPHSNPPHSNPPPSNPPHPNPPHSNPTRDRP